MWAGLLLRAACVALLLPGASTHGYTGRKAPGHFAAERRRLGPHVCLSGFGSGCCPGWAPSMGSGHCTLPLCSFGCGSGVCIAPNVCSCQDGEQGATCPGVVPVLEAHGPCGEYGCDLTCNHGGCQEVARVCPVGFSMTETAVGIRCTDIDECLSSSCEGHCVNTEGGFVCECGPGMQLSADRHSCQDTDECLGTPCQQRCRNSIGSYRCSCRPGFHLHGNRHSCVDVNECRRPLERRVCQHSCHNTVGSFLCTCRPGFRLRADRVSCEAFRKAVLAPSAILQPLQHPPKILLLPEAGRPALYAGHSPPSGAPGPPTGVRTASQPSPTRAPPTSFPAAPKQLPPTLMAAPVPSASLLGTLGPPSQLQEVTPALPRGPAATRLAPGPSACWHLGAMYESGSRWKEPECSQCWCKEREVTCEKVACEAACSHPIPAGGEGCCPSCTGCFHSGIIRAEGDVFSPPNENCTVCVCLAGNVSCISPECPPGPCHTSPKSGCCTCVPVRCYFHGRWYADGAVFSGAGDECTTCICQNGEVECSFMPCPELDCPREEWWLGPGQCCFTCREPAPMTGCSLDDNGVEFPIGQIWSPGDPCELCICQADGSVSCKRTDCVDSCPHPIHVPGQCCPDCSAGCTYIGRIFYNNQTFPSVLDPCLSCICLLGSVACSPVDCPITCTYPFHPDGECCPVCQDCNYEGRKVVNGQVFTLDDEPCTQCTCQLGEVSCETIPCQQTCSDPSMPLGDCCFSCPDWETEARRGDVRAWLLLLAHPASATCTTRLSPTRAPLMEKPLFTEIEYELLPFKNQKKMRKLRPKELTYLTQATQYPAEPLWWPAPLHSWLLFIFSLWRQEPAGPRQIPWRKSGDCPLVEPRCRARWLGALSETPSPCSAVAPAQGPWQHGLRGRPSVSSSFSYKQTHLVCGLHPQSPREPRPHPHPLWGRGTWSWGSPGSPSHLGPQQGLGPLQEPPLYLQPPLGLLGHLPFPQSPLSQPPGPRQRPDGLLCLPLSWLKKLQPFPQQFPAPQRPPSLSSDLTDSPPPPPGSLRPLEPRPATARSSPRLGPQGGRGPPGKQASWSGLCLETLDRDSSAGREALGANESRGTGGVYSHSAPGGGGKSPGLDTASAPRSICNVLCQPSKRRSPRSASSLGSTPCLSSEEGWGSELPHSGGRVERAWGSTGIAPPVITRPCLGFLIKGCLSLPQAALRIHLSPLER
nr:von Willebrand factor C and EGF domain-containing protein isoform X5 [Manis javanica]